MGWRRRRRVRARRSGGEIARGRLGQLRGRRCGRHGGQWSRRGDLHEERARAVARSLVCARLPTHSRRRRPWRERLENSTGDCLAILGCRQTLGELMGSHLRLALLIDGLVELYAQGLNVPFERRALPSRSLQLVSCKLLRPRRRHSGRVGMRIGVVIGVLIGVLIVVAIVVVIGLVIGVVIRVRSVACRVLSVSDRDRERPCGRLGLPPSRDERTELPLELLPLLDARLAQLLTERLECLRVPPRLLLRNAQLFTRPLELMRCGLSRSMALSSSRLSRTRLSRIVSWSLSE